MFKRFEHFFTQLSLHNFLDITSLRNFLYTTFFTKLVLHNITQLSLHNFLYTTFFTQLSLHNFLYTTFFTQLSLHDFAGGVKEGGGVRVRRAHCEQCWGGKKTAFSVQQIQ